MTRLPELFARLAAPFEGADVRARKQGGRELIYITARTAMNRLDSVLGPENWWDEYVPGENSVICKLTVRLPDGSTLTKSDAGGYAGMADQGDDDKSGFSDAFKRAAVKFGVGRHLYGDGAADFGPALVRELREWSETVAPGEGDRVMRWLDQLAIAKDWPAPIDWPPDLVAEGKARALRALHRGLAEDATAEATAK